MYIQIENQKCETMGCGSSKETSVSPLPAKVINGGTGHASSPIVQVDSVSF